MRIDLDIVRRLCEEQGSSLSTLLEACGVSRNAFYTLVRRESVLPRSVRAVAEQLGVPPATLLREEGTLLDQGRALRRRVTAIRKRHPEIDPDTVRHTLILLDEKPVERLRRALRRGRNVPVLR
jgi:transcriptional regulator with XRE-family HTH domain